MTIMQLQAVCQMPRSYSLKSTFCQDVFRIGRPYLPEALFGLRHKAAVLLSADTCAAISDKGIKGEADHRNKTRWLRRLQESRNR